jgi:hypothetical protein
MTASQAISSGLGMTGRSKWMVTIFFGCNLLLAAALAAPMHGAIADHVGHSSVGNELVQGFSAAWLSEFTINYEDFLKGFSTAVMWAGVLFLALNTVLSAGAFEVFARGQGAYMHAFGRGTGKYFGRFARIVILASILYFIAFLLFNVVVQGWLGRAFRDVNPDRLHFYLNWLRVILLFFAVISISALVDYAKADLVIDEHRSAIAAFMHATGFVLSHFGRVMAIYCTLGLLTTLSIVVYVGFARIMPQGSVLTILIWFLVAQALLWLRWMFRLASWGAATAYYGAHAAARQPLPEPVTAAVQV